MKKEFLHKKVSGKYQVPCSCVLIERGKLITDMSFIYTSVSSDKLLIHIFLSKIS